MTHRYMKRVVLVGGILSVLSLGTGVALAQGVAGVDMSSGNIVAEMGKIFIGCVGAATPIAYGAMRIIEKIGNRFLDIMDNEFKARQADSKASTEALIEIARCLPRKPDPHP